MLLFLMCRLETAIPLVVAAIRERLADVISAGEHEKIAVAFPDEGAEKRFRRQFPHEWTTITFAKVRQGDQRILKHKEGCLLCGCCWWQNLERE